MTARSQSANAPARSRRKPATAAAAAPAAAGDDTFAARLLAWFDVSGRHDLPWQHPRSPYRVWLSEIMLQQTQVKTAAPYFERFVARLPDLPALAAAEQDTVLGLWSGLGYYARARNLHAAAKLCVERHGGELPRDLDALTALPGIGRSTAAAILSQAWGDRHAILDGNVKRVLARYHGIDGFPGLPAVEKRLWALAESHLPPARMTDYTQAQMDLGATVCTRADPACILCPLQNDCVARVHGRTAELPVPKPGKAVPQRHAQVLWLLDRSGRVLLQRRPPTGIWAALWTLPQHEDDEQAERWFETHLDGEYADGEALAPIAHAFSHYKLELQPRRWRAVALRARVGDNDGLRWFAREELAELGIPAPIRKLIEAAG
ncbi:A/G-specific adenine glycosylase [Lysobacter enzymogenes]|uniref:Adenine DNA glycosylase n=1 Tax=Lysobacter enzymogenes TaxID=69 RepID=A0A0S2DK19_LYSEN|nr:A/G-specific adenine glycosylase [Lysobacter enzymogenes]ALN58880.1 A/G-specific adenine glycosylase [Lysobacter enzymogenes]QCW27148.1 A/G-specific adenine glycosylase [Lysobacter enzymogenes]